MAIVRQTIIDQIEIRRDGTVNVRLAKCIVDGDTIIHQAYHRYVLEPGADAATISAAVDAHLVAMGEVPVEAEDGARIAAVVSQEHTEAVIAAYRAKVERSRVAEQPAPAPIPVRIG